MGNWFLIDLNLFNWQILFSLLFNFPFYLQTMSARMFAKIFFSRNDISIYKVYILEMPGNFTSSIQAFSFTFF